MANRRLKPADMALRGRIGAHSLHARYDSRELTRKARATFLERFEREVDPDGKLDPEERRRRAAQARKAYFARLALQSVRKRTRSSKKPGSSANSEGGARR